MQRYPVRTSHRANLRPEALRELCRAAFESAEVTAEAVEARYGALERLRVRAEGKELAVEVQMNPKVAPEVAAETIRRYNHFLEEVTGYSSKERARRLRQAATRGPPSE